MWRVYQIFVLDVIGAGFHVQNPFLIVFLTRNQGYSVWKLVGWYHHLKQYLKKLPALSLGLCKLLINGSKVMGVVVALDLISYLEIPVKPSKVKIFHVFPPPHYEDLSLSSKRFMKSNHKIILMHLRVNMRMIPGLRNNRENTQSSSCFSASE